MRIRLKTKWARAKIDANGKIVGWDDYAIGDVVELNENPLADTDYEVIEEKRVEKTKHEHAFTKSRVK